MKLIIAGSRTVYPSIAEIDRVVIDWSATPFGIDLVDEVVTGGASGADSAGEEWALFRGHKLTEFPADWDRHGKAAGKLRNREMAEYGDALLAFWDGMSSGTCDMVTRMVARGKPVKVVPMKAGRGR